MAKAVFCPRVGRVQIEIDRLIEVWALLARSVDLSLEHALNFGFGCPGMQSGEPKHSHIPVKSVGNSTGRY